MSYTMTYDASHKVGRAGGHVQGFMRHIAREADEAAGYSFKHANTNIDTSRTHLNMSFVNDRGGSYRSVQSVDGDPPSNELEEYLNTRLATVHKSLRKDAVVMRGIVLQLDPSWFEDHCPEWRNEGLNEEAGRLTIAALNWASAEFGQANVVGGSIHLDEHSPQLQVMITPVTQDGRLSQKDFFKGPGDLKRQHRELRAHMEKIGYEVEHAVTERSTEHLSSSEFQARAVRTKRTAEKAAAHLADTERNSKKAWEDCQAAKTERDALQTERADLPKLRSKAKTDGYAEGRELAERDTAQARHTAEQTRMDAEEARAAARAREVHLHALHDEIERELREAGPPPSHPSYEDVRKDLLAAQSAVMTRFLKGTKFKDGTTLFDRFEQHAKSEFKKHQRRTTDGLGTYRGPSFEKWKERTVAAQSRLIRDLATEISTEEPEQDAGHQFGGQA